MKVTFKTWDKALYFRTYLQTELSGLKKEKKSKANYKFPYGIYNIEYIISTKISNSGIDDYELRRIKP